MNRFTRLMMFAGVAVGVAILVSIIHHYQLRFAVDSYFAELKSKGEPMDLAQVLPPVVSGEQNGAETLRQAETLFGGPEDPLYTNCIEGMRMAAPGKALIAWKQPDIRDSDGTNTWDNLQLIVARDEKALDFLHRIVQAPGLSFHIRYEAGVVGLDFSNMCLPEVKRSAMRLYSALECDLQHGDSAEAVTNLRTMLALTKSLKDERLAISELVRIAMTQIAASATWELLQSTSLRDSDLSALQNDWDNLEFIHAAETALNMERVTEAIDLAKFRSSDSEFKKYFELGEGARASLGIPARVKSGFARLRDQGEYFLWRYWWSYPDELRYLKGLESISATFRRADTNGAFYDALASQKAALDQLGMSNLTDEFDSLISDETDFYSILSQSVVSLEGFPRTVMRAQTAKEIVISAIALRRYQLKHENYPPNLESLVPEFIASVPTDPVDGKPLRYRLISDGTFLLYSVGQNGRDDGGDPSVEKQAKNPSYSWQNAQALDWVWPQPPSAAKIETFYKTLSKSPR